MGAQAKAPLKAMNTKHIKRHATEYIFALIGCTVALLGHRDIQKQMDSLSSDRERIAQSYAQTRQLLESAEVAKSRANIAIQRYKDGCTIVVAVSSPKDLATLSQGEPVLDRITKNPLPSGTIVCDINGNTALLKNNPQGVPVASDFAFTGNRELALTLVKKIHGAKVFYNTPEK